MAETIEEKVKNAPPNDKKEEKEQKGIVSSAFSELSDLIKSALKIGAVAAIPFAYSFLPVGPEHLPSAQAFTYEITAGRVASNLMAKKPALEGIVQEAAKGATLSFPIAKAFEGTNALEARLAENYGTAVAKAAKIGTWVGVIQPTITTTHALMTYGPTKKFKENVWDAIKTTFKYLALPAAINVGIIYKYGILAQMIVSGLISFGFGLVQTRRRQGGSYKNLFAEINPIPYIGATFSATGKLAKNVFYGVPQAFYAIGSSLRDLYKKAPKPATAPATHA